MIKEYLMIQKRRRMAMELLLSVEQVCHFIQVADRFERCFSGRIYPNDGLEEDITKAFT